MALAPGVVFALVVYFFRDPARHVPTEEPNTFVSPADGKLVEISELEHDEYIGGPACGSGFFCRFSTSTSTARRRGRG